MTDPTDPTASPGGPGGAGAVTGEASIPAEVGWNSWPAPDFSASPGVPDLDREHARARLRAELFQIESEPVRIGRFPILGRLGQGGMGTVFSAFDEELDRKIAVKVMLPTRGALGTQGRDRTRREAQAMARLSHPNIVAVHEVGETDEQLFIAMEFVRGVSLDVWLAQRSRAWREVLGVLCQAGRGLSAAHEAGLVHRDFKPSNVMVGDDGQIKILDFGLARAACEPTAVTEEASSSSKLADGPLTRTGALMGTPAFMAPEQLLSEPASALSDQFSFCVALYAALYGAHPFADKNLVGDQNLAALIFAVCEGTPASPPKDSPVPAWIRRVVLRGLSRAPEDRHPSMAALLDALAADPSTRRRRWLLGGTTIAAIVGGGLGIAHLAQSEACPDGRQALQDAWTGERRERVAAALREGAAHGAQTWTRVEPILDAYAEAWVASREAVCGALRSGAISDLLHERRVACLSRSRSALDALVEVFEQADATAVEKAVSAATGLPSLSRCEDAEGLLAEVEPPPDAIASEVTAARERLARARSMEDAGRVVPSVAAADEVLAQAEGLGYQPLLAEALLRRGSGELLVGQAGEADEDLGRATWVAVQSGDDDVAAEASARRIFVRSELLGRPADALIELPWARALAERTQDDALRGLFLHNAAAVRSRAGETEQARAMAQEALAVRRRSLSPDHPEIALTLANLGHFERDLGDYVAAIATLREAVRVTEVALGPRHPQRAMIGTVLATALLERGVYDDAAAELSLADAIHLEGLGAQAMPRYYVLVAMGELARRQRRWPEARQALQAALALAQPQVGAEHPMLADARLALAEVALAQGDAGEAETMGRAAVEQLEAALGGTHPYLTDAWLRLGRLRLSAGAPAQAEPVLARALDAARSLPSPTAAEIAWYELWHTRSILETVPATDVVRVAAQMQANLDVLDVGLAPDSPRLIDARAACAEGWLAAEEPARALALLEGERTALAGVRRADDPELTWLGARIAHLQVGLATDDALRSRAAADLEHAASTLAAIPAFGTEAREAARWRAN